MSLYSDNLVNRRSIGNLRVTRLEPLAIVTGNELCHYEWEYVNRGMDGVVSILNGKVSHHYHLGAPELLAKVYILISSIQNEQS